MIGARNIAALIIAALVLIPKGATSTENDADIDYARFAKLSKREAIEAAKELAGHDFAAGRLRILVGDKTIWSPMYEKHLKAYYGVEVTHFFRLTQPEKEQAIISAYDAIVKALLFQKFGKDIFKEAERVSRQR